MPCWIMAIHLLPSSAHRPAPVLALTPEIGLPLARAHEACGPARRSFALWLASRVQGPVIWIAPAWATDRLNPDGMHGIVDPGRFMFVLPTRAEDLAWSVEEVLRAGAVALVVADLREPPGLTAVRRMHLAAQTGAAEGHHTPLALLLTPGDGGAPGIETRWHMAPAHTPGARGWQLSRRRARTQPPRTWDIRPPQGGGDWQGVAQTHTEL